MLSGKQIQVGSVTGNRISTTGWKFLGFTGRNGAGAISLTGAAVGDRVAGIWRTDSTDTDPSGSFEGTISIINEIQQTSASNLSAARFIAVLLAPAS